MIKRAFYIFILLLVVSCSGRQPDLNQFLSDLDIESIDTLEADTLFSHAFEIALVQPVDHNNPEGQKFTQRIYLSYAGADRPVVLVTEGYGAPRNYTTELARYLDCNQIIVEHRYFGESVPENTEWQYLTTWQAASDHHRIIELFSDLFRGDWITTGISKGGQTVMFHSYYYPEDADISVPYVAPLNFGPEDPRIYTFLDTVGSDYCRERVFGAQTEILKNRDIYFPMMLEMAENRGLTFERIGGAEKAFEMAVLEYDFSFWQWGLVACDEILASGDPREIFNQFFRITDIEYFADSGIKQYEPFFYQALTEIGYYGYQFEKFGELLQYAKDSELPDFTFSAPEGTELEYDYDLAMNVDSYIRDAGNFIFIYGMQDTWSATAANLSGSSNSVRIFRRGGNHRSRINNLDDADRSLVLSLLNEWLNNSD